MTDAEHTASGADATFTPPYGVPPRSVPSAAVPAPDRGTEIAVATAVMVAVAVLGVLLGLLWHAVAPGALITMTSDGPVHADPNSERYFADDGWFALIGGVTGLLAAVTCWFTVRRYRGPVVLLGLVAGCLLSAVVAWQVGRQIGLADFRQMLDHAAAGRSFARPATLSALGVLGVQAFAAAFGYTLLAGWSRYPGLRRPPEPWSSHPGPMPPAGS